MKGKDHHKTWLDKRVTLAKWREKFYKHTQKELKTGEQFAAFFKKYDADSVQEFINVYAAHKVSWYEHGDLSARVNKIRDERCYNRAVEVMRRIQVKKLFNLVARWVNYDIELPGIEITEELVEWQHKVFVCPFLKPVERHEVDTYINFIQNLPPDETYSYQEDCRIWENRFLDDDLATRWDDPTEYGPWFYWYDKVYNTAALKDVPALRLKKQHKYRWTAIEHNRQNEPALPERERKPYLHLFKHQDAFIEKFEDGDFKRLHKAMQRHEAEFLFNDRADANMEELTDSCTPVAIEANDDWRQGLANAAEAHRREMLIEEIETVYEEYGERLRRVNGFEGWKEWELAHGEGWIENCKKLIKEGRALLGEPADLNF